MRYGYAWPSYTACVLLPSYRMRPTAMHESFSSCIRSALASLYLHALSLSLLLSLTSLYLHALIPLAHNLSSLSDIIFRKRSSLSHKPLSDIISRLRSCLSHTISVCRDTFSEKPVVGIANEKLA